MAKYPRNRSAIKRQKVTPRRSAVASPKTDYRDLYAGLIRLHVLHHAAKEMVYGFAMIEELRRHGYELSAGTLYPILHGLEQKGFLRSDKERDGRTERGVYRATPQDAKRLPPPRPRCASCSVNCSTTKKAADHERPLSGNKTGPIDWCTTLLSTRAPGWPILVGLVVFLPGAFRNWLPRTSLGQAALQISAFLIPS